MNVEMNTPAAVAQWLRERVTGELVCDSRLVTAGDGFVAWPGAANDGRHFVHSALQAGAKVAVVERTGVEAFDFDDARVIAVHDLKVQAGAIASAFHSDPSAALAVVAITGTNGKTSTAWWVAQVLSAARIPCAVVGTLGIGRPPLAGETGHAMVPTGLTTPDPVLLQSRLRGLRNDGLEACAIEASSIGLVEGRLNATRIRVAVFTNFTQDHLDFHGSMQAYWDAKAALFDRPELAAAVVNLDDAQSAVLLARLQGRSLDLWTVGVGGTARLSAQALTPTTEGMRFTVEERDTHGSVCGQASLCLPLVGQYNVSNLLCALAAARAMGVSLDEAVTACAALTPVPGRMERAGEGAEDQPLVLVDYAHTPDALEKALQALRPITAERGGSLWVVVGSGGDREATKRPLMAAVAERDAQRVVLTSDNPRSESPIRILEQMVQGVRAPAQALVEVDRAKAIATTVQAADARDVVLIAGKGHEDYQEVLGVKAPFSDLDHASAALKARPLKAGAQP